MGFWLLLNRCLNPEEGKGEEGFLNGAFYLGEGDQKTIIGVYCFPMAFRVL